MSEHTHISLNRSFLFVLIAIAFAAGLFVGRGTWLFGTDHEGKGNAPFPALTGEFRYIRQSLQQDSVAPGRKSRELRPFRYKVNSLVEETLAEGEAQSVSVYFRDLDNGNWFGIGEEERFSPEGLVKLPLLIAYFKWAETNPLVLRKRLRYSGAAAAPEPRYLKPPRPLEPGTSYTVNDLLFRMMAQGDNKAYTLLAENLPRKHLIRIYTDLYVHYDPARPDDTFALSAYAAFFRVLFNASYLNEELSEKALRYLAGSLFTEGMAAGVPSDVDIAAKAGERLLPAGTDDDGEVFQLHEFGIIYHPERPFLLGIAARGRDFETLASVISDITRMIYTEVDQQTN